MYFFGVLDMFNNEHVTFNLEQLNHSIVSDPICYHPSAILA